ncbi:MAG: hypothetical protein ACI97B_002059 [Verrucomicrobiales bacterium]|jgi:hypothetical protein
MTHLKPLILTSLLTTTMSAQMPAMGAETNRAAVADTSCTATIVTHSASPDFAMQKRSTASSQQKRGEGDGSGRVAKSASTTSTGKVNAIPYSIFDTILYDSGTQVLTLAFNNNHTYNYYGVPPLVYQDLIDARSPGAFYNQQIRRVFPCRRVHPDSPLQRAYTQSIDRNACPFFLTTRSR